MMGAYIICWRSICLVLFWPKEPSPCRAILSIIRKFYKTIPIFHINFISSSRMFVAVDIFSSPHILSATTLPYDTDPLGFLIGLLRILFALKLPSLPHLLDHCTVSAISEKCIWKLSKHRSFRTSISVGLIFKTSLSTF